MNLRAMIDRYIGKGMQPQVAYQKAMGGVKLLPVQHTQDQMRAIQYGKIDANPKLTPTQKAKAKAKFQFDDLSRYNVSKI